MSILHPSRVPIRTIASVVGQIMSMSLALGAIACLRTRALYVDINRCMSWHWAIVLSEEAKIELFFWQENTENFNGQSIWFESGTTRVVYSDASDSGFGSYSVEVGSQIAQGSWSDHEAQHGET